MCTPRLGNPAADGAPREMGEHEEVRAVCSRSMPRKRMEWRFSSPHVIPRPADMSF